MIEDRSKKALSLIIDYFLPRSPHEIGSAGISQGKSAINVKNRVISGEKEAKIELKYAKKANLFVLSAAFCVLRKGV